MGAFALGATVVRTTPWLSTATTRSLGIAMFDGGEPDDAHDAEPAITNMTMKRRMMALRERERRWPRAEQQR
jgi:hypothetical protein